MSFELFRKAFSRSGTAMHVEPQSTAAEGRVDYQADDEIELLSTTCNEWFPCVVEEVNAEGGIQVSVQKGIWISKEDQKTKVRRVQRGFTMSTLLSQASRSLSKISERAAQAPQLIKASVELTSVKQDLILAQRENSELIAELKAARAECKGVVTEKEQLQEQLEQVRMQHKKELQEAVSNATFMLTSKVQDYDAIVAKLLEENAQLQTMVPQAPTNAEIHDAIQVPQEPRKSMKASVQQASLMSKLMKNNLSSDSKAEKQRLIEEETKDLLKQVEHKRLISHCQACTKQIEQMEDLTAKLQSWSGNLPGSAEQWMASPQDLEQVRELMGSSVKVMKTAPQEVAHMVQEVCPKLDQLDDQDFVLDLTAQIQDLQRSIDRTVAALCKMRSADFLPVQGPLVHKGLQQRVDQIFLQTWEARLVWDVTLTQFQKAWTEAQEQINSHLTNMKAEGVPSAAPAAGKGIQPAIKGKGPAVGGKGKGLPPPAPAAGGGKGKGPAPPPATGGKEKGPAPPPAAGGKGKGPTPPPAAGDKGKGPAPPPAAGVKGKGPPPPPAAGSKGKNPAPLPAAGVKGKGPTPPPAAAAKGKGPTPLPAAVAKGKGPAPPPSGGGKGSPGPQAKGAKEDKEAVQQASSEEEPELEDEDNNDNSNSFTQVVKVARQKEDQPRLKKNVPRFDKAMLTNMERNFKTFVDELQQGGVANIADAFGGRGMVLLHACTLGETKKATARTTKAKKTESALIQIIKGNPSPVGDSRRFPMELKLKNLEASGPEPCGLVLPEEFALTWATHKLALSIASLDYDSLYEMSTCEKITLEKVIPEFDLNALNTKDAETIEKIRTQIFDAWFRPEERDMLLKHEQEKQVEKLDFLERKLLPLTHVVGFETKLKLLRINMEIPHLEQRGIIAYTEMAKGCQCIMDSRRLLDVLGIAVQAMSYVYNPSTNGGSLGFSLMNLPKYEALKYGKSITFRSIICFFLASLRPVILHKNKDGKKVPSRPFVQLLHDELDDARRAWNKFEKEKLAKDAEAQKDKNLIWKFLAESGNQLAEMGLFVQRQIDAEEKLFKASNFDASAVECQTQERFSQLASWATGRQQLKKMLQRIIDAQEKLDRHKADMLEKQRALQEYAALRDAEFAKTNFMDVITTIMTFEESLNTSWEEFSKMPPSYKELGVTLLRTAPLQVIFSANYRDQAFVLWKSKAEQKYPATPWTSEDKKQAILELFQLFDNDGDGVVDAQEVLNTLMALGLEIDSTQHYELVHVYDTEKQGTINLLNFTSLVEHRIRMTFLAFVTDLEDQTSSSVTKDHVITKDDLLRIAQEVPAEELDGEVSEAVVNKMINILDVGDSKDDVIQIHEFERLILMKPDEKTIRITDQNLIRASTRRKSLGHTTQQPPLG